MCYPHGRRSTTNLSEACLPAQCGNAPALALGMTNATFALQAFQYLDSSGETLLNEEQSSKKGL